MSVRLAAAVVVPVLAVITPATHGWPPITVRDGTMTSGATRLALPGTAPPMVKMAVLAQVRGVATLHTRIRARLVVGPLTVQFWAPSFSRLAKSVVHEVPPSRVSWICTLPATVDVHSMRRTESMGHTCPPFGDVTVTVPKLMTKAESLASHTDGDTTLHTRRRARLVTGPVTVHLWAPSSTRLAKMVVHVAPPSRESWTLTSSASVDCHSNLLMEPMTHASPPFGTTTVYSPAAGSATGARSGRPSRLAA